MLPHLTRLAGFALIATLGCQGTVTPPSGRPGDEVPEPQVNCAEEGPNPGRAPMRRLTVSEYDLTVRDLFGDETSPARRLVDNERGVESADARLITGLLVEQYMFAAEDIALRLTAVDALDRLLDCDRAAEGDDACADRWITRTAPLAYRRPVSEEQLDGLRSLYAAGRDDAGDFTVGLQLVIQAMLQSPDFLYRVEIVPVGSEPVVRLDGYQLATRLSYFLWGTTPDAELLDAAERGDLRDQAGLETQARRLISDPRAEVAIQRFFANYLDLAQLDELDKDPSVFPDFTPRIAELMRRETEAFVREVVIEGDGSWETLLTANWTMLNQELAAYYGLTGPSGEAFERVELDPTYHAGLLTHGSMMATRARTYETSPIHRGIFVRGSLICGQVPDVPEGLDATPPAIDPTLTTRQRLARHREDPSCAACHRQIDPLGFAFEHFDGAGRFRGSENDLPIDATGEIVESDLDGVVDGVPELAARVVGSENSQACFSGRWVVQALGRSREASDTCSLEEVQGRFVDSGFDIRELVVGLTLSDSFVYRVADQDTVTEVGP